MKPINKSLLFTYIILAIAVLEGLVVFYDIVHPFKDRFELASLEYDVPSRDTTVQPFLFETHSAQNTEKVLNEIVQQISYAFLPKVAAIANYQKLNSENEITEPESLPTNDEAKESDDDWLTEPTTEKQMPQPSLPAQEEKAQTSDATQNNDKKAFLAIVIDDMGVDVRSTDAIIALKKPITASFLTYGSANKDFALKAQQAGMEVMLHVPMMPHVPASLAPNTLSPQMNKEKVQTLFNEMLARYDGVNLHGVNNHMGSAFTENAQSMGYVMEILRDKRLYFLDSKTTGKSVCKRVAADYEVPYIARDVFLDNENDYDYIIGQLRQAEKIALKYGQAVAIGHPHSQTIRALQDWLLTVEQKGITLVHVSDLVYHKL